MRDVTPKSNTLRTARATGVLAVSRKTIQAIESGNVPKADPLGVARIAGIQAAKNTSQLIPYCHQVPLDFIALEIHLHPGEITIESEVKAIWKTGVEMEALVAVSAAALTLYDMLKIIDEEMEIRTVRLLEKKGGKSSLKITGAGLNAAVLVMSDSVSMKKKEDTSGKLIVEKLTDYSAHVTLYETLPDDRHLLEKKLKDLCDKKKVDLIITTGGTGVGPRDVTPEATLAVIDRRIIGIEETLRSYGQARMPMAMLSRGVVGVRGKTVIMNLPGSRGGAEDGMHAVFPALFHSFRMMKGEGHDGGGLKGKKDKGKGRSRK